MHFERSRVYLKKMKLPYDVYYAISAKAGIHPGQDHE